VSEVVGESDVIVVGNDTAEFRDVQGALRDDQVVIDLVRVFGEQTSTGRYQGICW